MNKVFIVLNALFLGAASWLLLGDEAGVTGLAVADMEIVRYIASYNATDLDTGETTKVYLIGQDVYFADGKAPIDEDNLIAIEAWNITFDVDGDEKMCSMQTYEVTKYYYDANGNRLQDAEEKIIYGSRTDDRGCVAAELPKGEYSVIMG